MPTLKMKMCEIIDRVSEIPDTEDCYIISVTGPNDRPLIPYEDAPGIEISAHNMNRFPWASELACRHNRRQRFVMAAAFLIAEIDRMDRLNS